MGGERQERRNEEQLEWYYLSPIQKPVWGKQNRWIVASTNISRLFLVFLVVFVVAAVTFAVAVIVVDLLCNPPPSGLSTKLSRSQRWRVCNFFIWILVVLLQGVHFFVLLPGGGGKNFARDKFRQTNFVTSNSRQIFLDRFKKKPTKFFPAILRKLTKFSGAKFVPCKLC